MYFSKASAENVTIASLTLEQASSIYIAYVWFIVDGPLTIRDNSSFVRNDNDMVSAIYGVCPMLFHWWLCLLISLWLQVVDTEPGSRFTCEAPLQFFAPARLTSPFGTQTVGLFLFTDYSVPTFLGDIIKDLLTCIQLELTECFAVSSIQTSGLLVSTLNCEYASITSGITVQNSSAIINNTNPSTKILCSYYVHLTLWI